MSNMIRTWFRRSNIANVTPQGSTEKDQTRPAGLFPPPPQQRVPPSPPKREVTPPPPPPPTSSPRRVVTPLSPSTPTQAAQRSPDPPMRLHPPKDIKEAPVRMREPQRKSPPEAPPQRYAKPAPPKSKAPSPKLSPHSLPPSHLGPLPEYDTSQKKMVVAEKMSKAHEREERRHGNSKKTLPLETDDTNTRFITIAGEDKGATIEIIYSPRNGSPNYLTKTGQSSVLRNSSSSGDEGERKTMNADGTLYTPKKAFVNKNVQMINNLIVYNSTASHHAPEVHFSLSKKQGNGFHVNDE